MKNQMQNMEEILDRYVGGFRQYILQEPIRLVFVSQNLCDMTGYTKAELLCENTDLYALLIHPEDKPIYADFLNSLSQKEQSLTVHYRIVRKDGTVIDVSDTMTSKREKNGVLTGYSVLTDITSIKAENSNLRFLNETVPCGLMKFTCEKHPKVTYINERMLNMLHFPKIKEGETDYLELCKENIFLMIPMEERRKFTHFLNQVYAKGAPIAGELTVLRCDGKKVRFYGWVTKSTNEQGQEEFQCVCMDITEQYRNKKANETERYLKALSDVYDHIFEYDFSSHTVKYVYGVQSSTFGKIRNIPMQLEEATEQWLQNSIHPDDLPRVRAFFQSVFANQTLPDGNGPLQIGFRSVTAKGEFKNYIGIFLKIDAAVSLFCCRMVPDQPESDSLLMENRSLKTINENMQQIVMQFTDGLAAFEVTDDRVTPLYASDNVCEFFGITKEEWLPLMKKSNSIKEFVAKSHVGYEKFQELLANGEAEFTYFDFNTDSQRRIKAICSQKHADGNSPRYVMLYNIDNAPKSAGDALEKGTIYIRTFGYFDVFVDDKPIAFRNKKSKELFALLVDRRGGYVSSEEAISFLWEDEAVNAVTLARYRKVALRLKNILEEYGITDIMESVDGKRRIVTEKVRCDLYDYLSQKEEYSQLFKGSYLTNYSWGEVTLGELLNENTI